MADTNTPLLADLVLELAKRVVHADERIDNARKTWDALREEHAAKERQSRATILELAAMSQPAPSPVPEGWAVGSDSDGPTLSGKGVTLALSCAGDRVLVRGIGEALYVSISAMRAFLDMLPATVE